MNLVLLGPDPRTADLKHIARLTGASGIERLDAAAFRLRDARDAPGLGDACTAARLDHAFVPEGRRVSDFRVIAFDMDSTLITIESIDEMADMQGVKREVAAITEAAMRGEIDFAESLRRRVGLLRGLPEAELQRVHDERLRLSPGVERMLAGVQRAGLVTLLVSGGFSFFATRLRERLGLDHACSNVLEVRDGRLTGGLVGPIVDAEAKAAALVALRDRLGVGAAQTVAVGDGANDLRFLAQAGVSVAWRAKPVLRSAATYRLDHAGMDGLLPLLGDA